MATSSCTPRASTPSGWGRSHAHELLAQAKEYGYPALALTDTNLCGALEFARLAGSLGIRPITGGELTLADGSRLTLLARTRTGYSNISRLFTIANAADRREPRLDSSYLPHHSEGVVLLTGGRRRAALPAGRRRPQDRGPGASEAVRGLVRLRLGVRRVEPEPPGGGTPTATGSW